MFCDVDSVNIVFWDVADQRRGTEHHAMAKVKTIETLLITFEKVRITEITVTRIWIED
jgi:hypothetical protein